MTSRRLDEGGDRLGWRYWLSLIRADLRWYGRRRRWAGLARSLWATVVERDNVERCNVCGRRYPWWVAPDDLYERVAGGLHGQLCPGCLDRGARDLGLRLVFVAREIDGLDGLNAVCREIGAFQRPVGESDP